MSTEPQQTNRTAAGASTFPGAPDGDTATSPADMTATRLVAGFSRGELSPREATEAVLERIARRDTELNAYCLVDADRARDAARASEERWHRGEPCGRLDGVPTSVKDVMLTRGWPTLRGSRTTSRDQDWREDSPAVARLREHGAVLVGKTTTPELAWKGVTDSPLTGVTRNPWDASVTPGGSSGGAAAAVAAGMAPLATGTDGGGSVRIPASFTGTATIKPTRGLVPHYPASPFGSLAHTGPITRTVADTALILTVLAGPDDRDWSALAPPGVDYTTVLDRSLDGVRIAYSATLGGVEVDPEVSGAVAAAVALFERLGARVEEVDPPVGDCREAFQTLWYSGAAKATQHLTGEQRELLDPGLRAVADEGRGHSAQDYLAAVAVRAALGERMGRFHRAHDLLVTPTTPVPAFTAGRETPPGRTERRWTGWAGFSYPFNMTQQPAASIPCGLTSGGLPVGLQIVGPRHADPLVLAASQRAEDLLARRDPL
ncbi:aspartyl-tRNA(Asn)/glutamyl-tRNA(Gln) amidotransferase subunit A [Haloactinospora alba]|uniref:Aspartyl-tRNA(Asn)/glutamyl-tRNA(Gln) amidotransferase subunit A n=1 Tax=Haloactinospora alba TaxID=405555 RepID=A0A543N903_9ACTN|nr:amidase [Haloactinospora alba]TQN28314.1 aspartyl-tRNA(Asn)/glutamyl-tRNA(Gln) amidotransferase subunit A [Haloactinospora alba]